MEQIRPTLTDQEVLDFCKKGYLILEGVIPEAINHKVFNFLESHSGFAPSEILKEDYFVRDVLLNSTIAGIIRSLLGPNFALPVMMANHRTIGKKDFVGGWHQDSGSAVYPPTCNYLQVFYYPQDVSLEMGPTALLPGTHLMRAVEMGHFGNMKGQILTAARAGSVFITAYPIWHRATVKNDPATRNLLKWCYWRTVAPERDWIKDPDFDLDTAEYGFPSLVSQSRWSQWSISEMFLWLCGKKDEYKSLGGQDWPLVTNNQTYPNMAYSDMKELFDRIHR